MQLFGISVLLFLLLAADCLKRTPQNNDFEKENMDERDQNTKQFDQENRCSEENSQRKTQNNYNQNTGGKGEKSFDYNPNSRSNTNSQSTNVDSTNSRGNTNYRSGNSNRNNRNGYSENHYLMPLRKRYKRQFTFDYGSDMSSARKTSKKKQHPRKESKKSRKNKSKKKSQKPIDAGVVVTQNINKGIVQIERDMQEYTSRYDIQSLLKTIISANFNTDDHKCMAIISDPYYNNIFQKKFLNVIGRNFSYYMVLVKEYEDLISPGYKTLQTIKQIKKEGCKIYLIFCGNGNQVARLLRFGDRHRMIDTRANFLMLYDTRLFHMDLHYLWKRIVNVIFIRRYKNFNDNEYNMKQAKPVKQASVSSTPPTKKSKVVSSFELTTVPFPNPIREILVPKRVNIWRAGKFTSNTSLFEDKTSDLRGQALRVAVLQHIPAVVKIHSSLNSSEETSQNGSNFSAMKNETNNLYSGVEIEALKAFGKAINFNPLIYEKDKSAEEQWGRKQIDGSYDGLLGEVISGKADIALGDLHYTLYHLDLIDLTVPYTSECLTFLTPEALTDNSWQTLILPFTLHMWIGVLVGLVVIGLIFYGLAHFQYMINSKSRTDLVPWIPPSQRRLIRTNNSIDEFILANYYPIEQNYKTEPKIIGLYLFSELFNSFLYTYSMLLVVSLPKLPSGWSLRILTGCYWLYCILIVVSYRASMTAILANPAPRVTIDTLQELADSKVRCGGWGEQILDFFQTSLDAAGQAIGNKFENVDDPDEAVTRIAKGEFAYYENQYFLKAISVKRQVKLKEDREKFTQKKSSTNNTIFSTNATPATTTNKMPQQTVDDETNSTSIYEVKDERNLHIMSSCVIQMPISLGLQKNSPLKPDADKFLRRIIEAGLIEKWLTDVMTPTLNAETDQGDTVKALMNLKKLYGGFVSLFIGYGISVLMLIAELIYWKYYVTKRYDKYSMKSYYSRQNRANQKEMEKKKKVKSELKRRKKRKKSGKKRKEKEEMEEATENDEDLKKKIKFAKVDKKTETNEGIEKESNSDNETKTDIDTIEESI